jgi:hypothetical protein
MAEAQGKVGQALLEVGHFAGVKLDVGPAQADALHVDQQLALLGYGRDKFLHTPAPRAFDDQGAHYRPE